jgi:hypothetical protein
MLGAMMTGHPTCGPCEQEAGKSVLLAIPVMIATGFLIQWLYRRCWKGLRQLTIFDSKSRNVTIGVGVSLGLLGLLAPHSWIQPSDSFQYSTGYYVLESICIVGTSYITWLTICLRLGIQIQGWPWWNRYILLLPLITIAPLAMWLALCGSHDKFSNTYFNIFAIPGMLGLVAGPLLLLLLGEPLLRRHRAKRKKRNAEQLPKARLL